MTAREKALSDTLAEIARICRDCAPGNHAYTVGLVGSMARIAVEGSAATKSSQEA